MEKMLSQIGCMVKNFHWRLSKILSSHSIKFANNLQINIVSEVNEFQTCATFVENERNMIYHVNSTKFSHCYKFFGIFVALDNFNVICKFNQF